MVSISWLLIATHVSVAVQIATATQLLYILMYAQSSSIATASSLWCELSDQVREYRLAALSFAIAFCVAITHTDPPRYPVVQIEPTSKSRKSRVGCTASS